MKKLDLAGKKFGRLSVIDPAPNKGGRTRWNCVCDCGNLHCANTNHLVRGYTRSCGCLKEEIISSGANTTHGKRRSRIYSIWCGIKDRCLNKKSARYSSYGGRGITVCERWMTFENFYEDMGDAPNGMSVDRINNDLGYSPENCKWSTPKEQANNTRRNVKITVNGETKNACQWMEKLRVKSYFLKNKTKNGATKEEVIMSSLGLSAFPEQT